MKAAGFSVRRRMRETLIAIVVVMLVISAVMAATGMQLTRSREEAQMRLKMNALSALISNENRILEAAEAAFDGHLTACMRAQVNLLGALVTEEGYTGPRVLSKGFVVRLTDGGVQLPEGLPEGEMGITRRLIDRSLASGKMRTGRFMAENPLPERGFMTAGAGTAAPTADDADAGYSREFFLSFMGIAQDWVYVDMTSRAEFDGNLSRYTTTTYTDLSRENGGLGGITLMIGEREGEVKLLRSYGEKGILNDLADAGFTAERVRDRVPAVSVGGKTYRCTYDRLHGEWDGWENPLIVQLVPAAADGLLSVLNSLIILYAIALIFINMAVYVLSVQRFVRENVVTSEQAARYAPKRLRVRMLNAGVIGAVAVLAMTLVIQGVGQLHTELNYGRETLKVFSRQLEQVDEQRTDALVKLQEEWYVLYGEQMAALMSAYPELTAPERLQTVCDILDVDYIMLFDSRGQETQCSRDYVGFTLDRDLGPNSADFRRLLYGMPAIVHAPAADSITGLQRQMIGVKLPAQGGSSRHGALMMALLPEKTRQLAGLYQVDNQLAVLNLQGTLCFTADAATGKICHASDAAMVGKTTAACGLSEKSLRGGYMDFEVIGGSQYFIVTEQYGDNIFYYAIEAGAMFDNVMMFSVIVMLLFALGAFVILSTALRGYDDQLFDRWAVVRLPEETVEEAQARQNRRRAESGGAVGGGQPGPIRSLLNRLAEAVKWREKLPEEKVNLVFKLSILLLLISWANLLLTRGVASNRYDTLAGFLLQGDWMRGANLFAFCSIFLVVAYAYMICVISQGVLLMASGFLMGKGQTFCRLLYSFIKYFAMFVVLYLTLQYLGFPIGTVVGSLSITTLALSLGAKDLASDILAGLSIVFERTFQVGDIVEINGTRGKVEEIGVRATRLIVPGNNVLIISNHQIQGVLNLTMDISRYTMELKVQASESLERLEKVIIAGLPAIERGCDKIDSIEYLGVMQVGSATGLPGTATMTLGIRANCQQTDMWDVQLYLNRQVKLLCERENIEIR